MFEKRIAFVISKSHLHPNGGIGQFAKSFVEMAETFNWRVDIILDMQARKNDPLVEFLEQRCQFITPDEACSYARHTSLFQFGDSFNIEKILNFQNALLKAFSRNIYDLVISNTPEATPAYQFLDLSKFCPLIHYTHIENSVFFDAEPNDTFRDAHTNFLRNLNECADLVVGTQSDYNAELIKSRFPRSNAMGLPMPVPELGLLDPKFPDKKGVLFIGRFEERKNPKLFAKVVSEAKLPAKVLTKPNSVPKFEKLFLEHGITDYEIKAGIIGEEKTQFIKSARAAFHPSLRESYGFSAFESLHSCPTLLIREYDWWKNFEEMGVETSGKKDATQKLIELYNRPYKGSDFSERMRAVHNQTFSKWKSLIDGIQPESTKELGKNKLVEVLQEFKTFRLHDYWFKHLNRTNPNIPDFQSVWSKRVFFKTIQTETDSWLSIEDQPNIPEKSGVSLFDF